MEPPSARPAPLPPYRRVCLCLDDVTHVGTAMAEAARLAPDRSAMTLLHVAPSVTAMESGLSEWGLPRDRDPLAEPRRWLEQTAEAASAGEAVMLTSGAPAEAACDWAAEAAVDLMVVAAAKRGLERPVLGSFSSHLARHAPCPVLVLPRRVEGTPPPAVPAGPFGHVAAVVDGSEDSTRALAEAERIAALGAGTTSVVRLRSRWRAWLQAIRGRSARSMPSWAVAWAREIGGGEPPVRLAGPQGRALGDWARESGVDLLVVPPEAPHMGGVLRRAGEALVRQGNASLLVARPAAA